MIHTASSGCCARSAKDMSNHIQSRGALDRCTTTRVKSLHGHPPQDPLLFRHDSSYRLKNPSGESLLSKTHITALAPEEQSVRRQAATSGRPGSQQARACPLACVGPPATSSSPSQLGQTPNRGKAAVLLVGAPSTAPAWISLVSAARATRPAMPAMCAHD